MSKLRIGFSRPHSKSKIFAALIMWWDRYRFGQVVPMSHGYARFISASWDRDFIYQASGHQTHFLGGTLFGKINQIAEEYELEMDEEAVLRIGRLCVDREGKPYALKQVFGQGLVALAYIVSFGKWEAKNPLADRDAQVTCIEEMAVLIADALGIAVPLDMETTSVWPFRCWLVTLPQVKRVA